METTHSSDELTPLLGTGSIPQSRLAVLRRLATNSEVETSLESPAGRSDAASNLEARLSNVSIPTDSDLEIDEVSLEEVVFQLCEAWRQHRQPKGKITIFHPIELYAMHLAWNDVTNGRRCSLEASVIVEAVAVAIAAEINQREENSEDSSSWGLFIQADRKLLTAILLREWELITTGVGFPDNYTPEILEDYQEPPITFVCGPRLEGGVQIYENIRNFLLNFRLQIFMNCLLLIWPIIILFTGTKYMDCPMDHRLPYLLILLGVVGCLATVSRMSLIWFASKHRHPKTQLFRKWIISRLMEFAFLAVLIGQAVYFFRCESRN